MNQIWIYNFSVRNLLYYVNRNSRKREKNRHETEQSMILNQRNRRNFPQKWKQQVCYNIHSLQVRIEQTYAVQRKWDFSDSFTPIEILFKGFPTRWNRWKIYQRLLTQKSMAKYFISRFLGFVSRKIQVNRYVWGLARGDNIVILLNEPFEFQWGNGFWWRLYTLLISINITSNTRRYCSRLRDSCKLDIVPSGSYNVSGGKGKYFK